MAVSDKIKAALNLRGRKIMELADYFEMSPQAMRNKLNRSSFSAEDLIKVSMFLDAKIKIELSGEQSVIFDSSDIRSSDESNS